MPEKSCTDCYETDLMKCAACARNPKVVEIDPVKKIIPDMKPCPFCGGEAVFIGDTSSIKCQRCGGAFIVTNPLISRLEAKEAWDRRGGGAHE